jgi:AcrR family transcriptional regulator
VGSKAEKRRAQPADTMYTRAEVAARLGVSTSTVRRYEGDKLHPVKGADGVNRFDAKAVAELAATLLNEREGKPPRKLRNAAAPTREAKRTDGEIAADVFARLEQRQSLAEIVIGVRVEPELVRELHRQWQTGLIDGELDREQPVLPMDDVLASQERHVSDRELRERLASLPSVPTRLSIARDLGADFATATGNTRRLIELGGFVVFGPSSVEEIVDRYGSGAYRVTAYALDPTGLRWEVLTRIEHPTRTDPQRRR